MSVLHCIISGCSFYKPSTVEPNGAVHYPEHLECAKYAIEMGVDVNAICGGVRGRIYNSLLCFTMCIGTAVTFSPVSFGVVK